MRGMKTSHQSLIYPLNVYAELLELAFGRSDFLSYGLQAQPELSVAEGQQAMAAQLTAMIAAAPGASVLDVGCGTGILAQQLARAGYQVTAIDVNEQAIHAAQQRFASTQLLQDEMRDGLPKNQSEDPPGAVNTPALALADLQTFAPGKRFDVVVLQNSARYLSPLAVFSHARRLLKTGGQLLVQEEFTGDDTEQAPEPLPVLRHVLNMATRNGYVLVEHRDVSAGVANWMQRCLDLFDRHLMALGQCLDLSAQQLLALRQAMADDMEKCHRGRYVHALLAFRMDVVDVTLLPADCLPVDCYRVLFERSFDTGFDPALWQWKYGDGRGHSVVACKDEETIAHYGGISRDILYFGKPERALQICDVMVMPQHRSFYSKRGLFFSTAASTLELHAGNTASHLLGFGFPNLKAMHVAQRMGLYAKTDELLALSYPAASLVGASADETWAVISDDLNDHHAALIDALWQQMATAFTDSIIGLRDRAYLSYRYPQRPGLDYRFLVQAGPAGGKALAVIRDHGEQSLIMDVIAAGDDLPSALRTLCQYGHETGRPMVFWLSAGQRHRVQTPLLQTEATGINIPCNVWTQGPSAETLRGRWWLTAGDMDFL